MIDMSVLPFFLAAVATLLVVPGPTLCSSPRSLCREVRVTAWRVLLGIFLAGILQTCLVAAGLGKAMEAWPSRGKRCAPGRRSLFGYLGVRLVITWSRRRAEPAHVSPSKVQSPEPCWLWALSIICSTEGALVLLGIHSAVRQPQSWVVRRTDRHLWRHVVAAGVRVQHFC